MTLTQLFLRFVKNEHLYTKVKLTIFDKFIFYDGVIENLLYYGDIQTKNLFYVFGNDKQIITFKWIDYIKQNKINDKITEKVDKYTNFATKTLKDFIAMYGIEKAVTTILYARGKIKQNKINDNDIDKILREKNIRLIDMFQHVDSFCCWEDYNHVLKHTQFRNWGIVHNKWSEYLSSNNYNKNIRV